MTNENDGEQRRPLTRREALRLFGIGATAAAVAACAPTTGGTATAAPVAAATSAPSAATAAPATAAPATPSPTPQRTPFSIASMTNPLIDDHTHPIVPSQGDQLKYFDGLVELMDQNNVAYSVMHRNAQWVSSDPTFGKEHDDWVRAAMERHPGRILGGLGGFDPRDPAAPVYVRAQLQTGKWAYIGELDLRNPGPKTQIAINSPAVLAIAKVAAEFKVPFVFHYNYDYGTSGADAGMLEVEDAVAKNPDTIFVQAHNPPIPLMLKYANIWGEMTAYSTQTPNQQFLQQLAQRPDAFDRLCLAGSDMQTPDLRVGVGVPTPISYKEAMDASRRLLATLSSDARDKIAYKNLLRLFKLQ